MSPVHVGDAPTLWTGRLQLPVQRQTGAGILVQRCLNLLLVSYITGEWNKRRITRRT